MPTITTKQTLEFLHEYLQVKEAKILNVSSGQGDLAKDLNEAGYQVTSFDASADFLEFTTETRFDAVLFTNSLHHIKPLDTLFNKVKSLLTERGKILVDDFSLERVDARTAGWFYELFDLFSLSVGQNVETVTPGEGPLERWKKRHGQTTYIHTGRELLRETERHFGNFHSFAVPYLYRYFSPLFSGLPNGELVLQRLYEWELKLIETKQIEPIGLRIVAKKYFSYLK